MVVDIIKVMPSLEELSFEIIGEAFISNRCQRAARDGSAARLERVKGLHWQHTGVDSAHMASLFPSLERLCVDLNWRAECESKEVAELIGPFADLPVLSLLVVGQLEPWPEQDIEGRFFIFAHGDSSSIPLIPPPPQNTSKQVI